MRTIAPLIVAATLVLAGVVLAFTLTGSPRHQRELAFDRSRLALLEEMSNAIENRYTWRQTLPGRLPVELVKHDPESGKAFEYHRMDRTAYEICAVFTLPSPADTYDHRWDHGKGHHCFVHRLSPRD